MNLNEANEPMRCARGFVVGTLFRQPRVMHDAKGVPFMDGALITEVPRQFASGQHKLTIMFKSYQPDAVRLVPILKERMRVRIEGDIVSDVFADKREGQIFTRTQIIGTLTLLEEVTP